MKEEHFIEFPFADYLLVFISIIVGYVVTEFFAGWGGLIRNRKQIKIYWLHLAWTINFFVQLIENWWWLWGNRLKLAENAGYFFYTLASPLLFYLISVFLFPTLKENEVHDFDDYFYKNKKYIFLLFCVLMVVYFINNLWIRKHDLISIDNMFCISGFVFGLLNLFINNRLYQVISFSMGFVILLIYTYINS